MYDLPKENIQKDFVKKWRELSTPPCPQVCRNTYPNIGEKKRKSCIKNIQIVHCVIKSLGHFVHPFWKSAEILGYCWTANNIIVQWLRLQTLMQWSPYPLQTYTKCWRAFTWCEWAPGLIIMPLKPHLCGRNLEICILGCITVNNVTIKWLRLQTHIEWSPSPLQIYTRCWNVFICCEWTPWSNIMTSSTVLCGHILEISWNPGLLCYKNNIMSSKLRQQTLVECSPNPQCTYTKCCRAIICSEWTPGCQYHAIINTTMRTYFGNLLKSWVTSVL